MSVDYKILNQDELETTEKAVCGVCIHALIGETGLTENATCGKGNKQGKNITCGDNHFIDTKEVIRRIAIEHAKLVKELL